MSNPLYNILDKLKSERLRRQKALDSNMFCDNKLLESNIRVLDETIEAMEEGFIQEDVSEAYDKIFYDDEEFISEV